jgi:hypothetical protein
MILLTVGWVVMLGVEALRRKGEHGNISEVLLSGSVAVAVMH